MNTPTRTKTVLSLAAVLAVLALGGQAHAMFITPTGVTASASYGGAPVVNLINNSGLSSNAATGTHDNHSLAGTMWMSNGGTVANEWLVFDLGQAYELTDAYIWQMNQGHAVNAGGARNTRTMDIYVSADNVTYAQVGSTRTLGVANGSSSALPAETVSLSASNVRYVKFDILTAGSGNTNEYVGLSEVRFEDTSVPTVVNPSFEEDDVANGSHFDGDPIGWSTTGAAGPQDYNDAWTPQPTDGVQHAYANGGASLSQTLSDVITDGEVYTLTVDVGEYSGFSGSLATIRLYGSTAGVGTALSNANGTAELTGIDPTNGFYTTDLTVTYTALASGDPFAGQSVGIALIGESGTQVTFDNVRFDITPIPEPSTLALFSLGLLGLLGWGRRKKQ